LFLRRKQRNSGNQKSDFGPFEKIVLVGDATQSGIHAAELAIELAESEGVSLTVVSTIDTQTLRQLLSKRILVPDEMHDFETELEESAKRQLRAIEQMAKAKNVEVELVLLKGSPSQMLLAECEKRGSDLIVMGAFRQSSVARDLVARERQLILDSSPCPVLVVP